MSRACDATAIGLPSLPRSFEWFMALECGWWWCLWSEVSKSSVSSSSLNSDVGWPVEPQQELFALWHPLLQVDPPEVLCNPPPLARCGLVLLLLLPCLCSVLHNLCCSSNSRMARWASAAWWAQRCSNCNTRWAASSNACCNCSRSVSNSCIRFSRSDLRLCSTSIYFNKKMKQRTN